MDTYWINVIGTLKMFNWLVLIVSNFLLISAILFRLTEGPFDNNYEDEKRQNTITKRIIIITIILIILSVIVMTFVPNERILIEWWCSK